MRQFINRSNGLPYDLNAFEYIYVAINNQLIRFYKDPNVKPELMYLTQEGNFDWHIKNHKEIEPAEFYYKENFDKLIPFGYIPESEPVKGKHKCNCTDFVVYNFGCKCGGI